MKTSIDLSQFRGRDRYRPKFRRVFSYGGHSYASNGRVAIRVGEQRGFFDTPVPEVINRIASAERCTLPWTALPKRLPEPDRLPDTRLIQLAAGILVRADDLSLALSATERPQWAVPRGRRDVAIRCGITGTIVVIEMAETPPTIVDLKEIAA